jgi:mannose-6-phosphate isomerase-like protein (cupin superfamily)
VLVTIIDEKAATWEHHADRRSADLITSASTAAHAGLLLGVAEYTAIEFGELQRHPDQEAVYCVSGRGVIRVGDDEHEIMPGRAVYIGRDVAHSTRRTGPEPVKVIYVHAPD